MKASLVGLIGAALLSAGIARADAPTGKFGVVDMQQVILSVEEGKAARAALEAEIKTKEAELQKNKEELDKMNKEWKDQAALLSEDARLKKQQEFQEKFLALRNAEMEFQANIKRKEQKATQEIAMKVAGIVDQIARAKKLSGVFETNSAGLLYLDSPVDLTQDVIADYSKKAAEKPAEKKK
jgi:outer membrane protein